MKITIAVPCGDQLETEFVKSLIGLSAQAQIRIDFIAGSLVYVARENLAAAAIDSESDYVLWLDSDMVFPPQLLEDMLEAAVENDLDYLTALCFARRPPYKPCIYKRLRLGLPGESETEQYTEYPEGLFEIEASGFAAVLTSGKLLREVYDQFHAGFMPLPGYGEDISFCIRARKLGYKLWCDSRLKIGHITRTVVTEDTYRVFSGKEV